MFSQLIKQCIQNAPHKINNVKMNVRFLCQVPTKEQQIPKQNPIVKDNNMQKAKYLGYQIIYQLPFIKYISLYNKTKRNMLISANILLPIIFVLHASDIMTEEFSVLLSGCACAFTMSLYIAGIVFDNQIGIIYYKDDKHIKIAYVDIWGKRIDVNTSVEDIKSLTTNRRRFRDRIYRTIHISSLKFPLKLIVDNSIISNKELLASVLGDYE